jgi:sugar lactone lactonase YvrE
MNLNRPVRAALLAITAAFLFEPAPVVAQVDHLGTNLRPNPFRTIEGWAKLPRGRTWGSTSAVDIDADGVSVWVGERCGANTCRGNTTLDPILKFDADGNLVKSFGAGMIAWPHGIHVDFQGNVWVVDGQSTRPTGNQPAPASIYGMQVMKFSPEGELLMTLGEKGGAPVGGEGFFWEPNDVLVAPNGDIFVVEGHGNNRERNPARLLKFNKDGELLKVFGEMGSGPGQFLQPHALAMDSRGRLFVGDRGNNRVQIFDQDLNFIDMWYQFSRPSGLDIDHNDVLYSADSESGSFDAPRTGWLKGIRIGSAVTGEVKYFIPNPVPTCTGTCAAEGVAADRNGVIYGAEVGPQKLQRYIWRDVQ